MYLNGNFTLFQFDINLKYKAKAKHFERASNYLAVFGWKFEWSHESICFIKFHSQGSEKPAKKKN